MANLISIDFEKAFNSMDHKACIQMFERKGCCPHLLRMIGAFLLERKTRYKINKTTSDERPVFGGSPQGTLLGNFLFVIATDNLEEGCQTEEGPLALEESLDLDLCNDTDTEGSTASEHNDQEPDDFI